MPNGNSKDIAAHCLQLMLEPVMRFCLRRSLKMQEISETVKLVLISAAVKEIERLDQKVSISRLSIMTGIHRGDVMRIYRGTTEPKSPENIVVRLIGAWQSTKKFQTKGGRPRILELDGIDGEFAELVRSVSAELSPYTILFELERLRVVTRTAKGIRLDHLETIVTDDVAQSFKHFSQDSDDFLHAVEENVLVRLPVPNLHLRTEYDNVGSRHIPTIRNWFINEGSAFHARARKFLSRFDRDITPDKDDASFAVRVALCSFSRIEDPSAAIMTAKTKKER